MQHGTYEVEKRDRVVILRLKGSFNHEGCIAFVNELKQNIEPFGLQHPFAFIFNIIKLEGGTPEAYAELELYNQWLNERNMIAKGMVFSSRVKLTIGETLTPSRSSQNIENFTDETDALIWVQQELETHS